MTPMSRTFARVRWVMRPDEAVVGTRLGSGAQCSVYALEVTRGRPGLPAGNYALRLFTDRMDKAPAGFARELATMTALRHLAFVPRAYGLARLALPTGDSVEGMVMERVVGITATVIARKMATCPPDLTDIFASLTVNLAERAVAVMQDLMKAGYMQEDFHTDNLMVRLDGSLMVVDFDDVTRVDGRPASECMWHMATVLYDDWCYEARTTATEEVMDGLRAFMDAHAPVQ